MKPASRTNYVPQAGPTDSSDCRKCSIFPYLLTWLQSGLYKANIALLTGVSGRRPMTKCH